MIVRLSSSKISVVHCSPIRPNKPTATGSWTILKSKSSQPAGIQIGVDITQLTDENILSVGVNGSQVRLIGLRNINILEKLDVVNLCY